MASRKENNSTVEEKNILVKKYLFSVNGVDKYVSEEEKTSFETVGILPLATVTTNEKNVVVYVETDGTEVARKTVQRVATKSVDAKGKKGSEKEKLTNKASEIFEKINSKNYEGLFEDIENFFKTGTPVALVLQPFTTGSDFHIATKDELPTKENVVKFENANAKGVPISKLFNQKSSAEEKTFEQQVDIMLKNQNKKATENVECEEKEGEETEE